MVLSSLTIIQVWFHGEWGLCTKEEEGTLAASRRNKISGAQLDYHEKDAVLADWRDVWKPPTSMCLLCSPLRWRMDQAGMGVVHPGGDNVYFEGHWRGHQNNEWTPRSCAEEDPVTWLEPVI